ncbi:MAG: methyltransferase domain-containing protein [Polyangiaceae bacterium]|nr:methyltransferase domain-containing protein [Polyangiaceae bacterium]
MTPESPFSKLMRERIDPTLERFARFVASFDLRRFDPMLVALAPHRKEAMRRVIDAMKARASAIEAEVITRDPRAASRFDDLVAEALEQMRAIEPDRGRATLGPFDTTPLLSSIERRLYRNAPEWLDDPSFPAEQRIEALDRLDRVNRFLGSYDTFTALLMPLIEAAERAGRSPVRVHDLASGHAGFAVLLKQVLGDRVVVEASDIKAEYLDIGRARASSLGVPVDFFIEDALAMDGIRARGVDIVVCTQALHHFPPGMVARMIGEASRAANIGACFIDGERSWVMLSALIPAATFISRSRTLLHDGIVSMRRMYYREELELLGALAPGVPADVRVEVGSSPPAHIYLRLSRAASSGGASR